MTTTIIWAPHPDDETLYLAGYIDHCRNRGDKLILVAVTDGGGSGAKPSHWTQSDLMRVRSQEQCRAWHALTGQSHIIRMEQIDGSVKAANIRALAEGLEDIYITENVEHYVAGHSTSPHPDHGATALGVKQAGVRIVRGSLAPSEFTVTAPTTYTPADKTAVTRAFDSYRAFGHVSVNSEFQKLRSNLYTTKVKVY